MREARIETSWTVKSLVKWINPERTDLGIMTPDNSEPQLLLNTVDVALLAETSR